MKRFISPPHARIAMAVAALVGLFASTYLLYEYVTGGPITCGLSSGCEVVRASKWAYMAYGIPRPALGVAFYAGLFALLILRVSIRWKPRMLYWLTMLAAVAGILESAFLFFIQWLDIKAFCTWCLVSAAATVVIAAVTPFDHDEEHHAMSFARELKIYFLLLVLFVPVSFVGLGILLRPPAVPIQSTLQAPSP